MVVGFKDENGASRVSERSVDPLSRSVEIDSLRLTASEPFDSLFDCSRPGQRPLSGILGIATFQTREQLRSHASSFLLGERQTVAQHTGRICTHDGIVTQSAWHRHPRP
jgi:hypothetical protein